MQIARQTVVAMMRRVGLHDTVNEAIAVLPDPVDTDRDAALLLRFGLDRGRLMDTLGGSP